MGEYQANALMDFLPNHLKDFHNWNRDSIKGLKILNECAEQLKTV